MTEGIDFAIESVSFDDLVTKTGWRVVRCVVRSHFSQLLYEFDDRSGSWQTTRTDESGRRAEPRDPALPAAMQRAADKLRAIGDNPFMTGGSA